MVILVFETWSLQFFCDLLNGQKTNYLQLIQYKLYFDVGVSTQLANRKRGKALSNLLLLEQYEVLSKNSKLNENTHRERKKNKSWFWSFAISKTSSSKKCVISDIGKKV